MNASINFRVYSLFPCIITAIVASTCIVCPAANSMPTSMYPDYVLGDINTGYGYQFLTPSQADYFKGKQKFLLHRQAQLLGQRGGKLTLSDERILRAEWQSLDDEVKDAEGLRHMTIGGGPK